MYVLLVRFLSLILYLSSRLLFSLYVLYFIIYNLFGYLLSLVFYVFYPFIVFSAFLFTFYKNVRKILMFKFG